MSNLIDYLEGGFRVFGLHGADAKGRCECGDLDCGNAYKHPILPAWQSVPQWSQEQIDFYHQIGHFKTGWGILVRGYLVIDVDARNGGVESFAKLCAACPEAATAEFVVNTGSGGGSQHHYFRVPEGTALVQTLHEYPGIDFKSSGFVVGAGSMHASGTEYEIDRGFPQDVGGAPQALLDLLARPEYFRVSTETGDIDVNADHVAEMLSYITNDDADYEKYIRIGMAVHHVLQGDGFDLWDNWARKASKYEPNVGDKKWHSFGRSPNPAGYGTLKFYAKEGGWVEQYEDVFHWDDDQKNDTLNTDGVDLLRPPGFVGELTKWINDQCLYPREHLAVAAALTAVSGLAGMRHVDTLDDMSANIIAFCVAGSGTGKEAVAQAYLKIMRAAEVQSAVHGGFKSEQEVMRNLIRHQAALYCVDELGLVLRKLENASKRGGASYLEGIVGLIMSVYSKANGYLPITGDLKEEIKLILIKDLARIEKKLDDLPADSTSEGSEATLRAQADQARAALAKIDDGLDSPYLTILGYTTPVTFNDLMGFEQATNGFMARAMIFSDLETNPKRKAKFSKVPMNDALQSKIRNLYAPGHYNASERSPRIEFTGEKSPIPTTEDGQDLLHEVYEQFHEMAETHKGTTGLEAIPRRGYELASKISLILALPEGVRTAEHIRWAFAAAKRDVEHKIKLAHATDNGDIDSGLAAKILSLVTAEHGETEGVICNRLRSTPKEQVKSLIARMVDKGLLVELQCEHAKNKRTVIKYLASA